MGQITEGQKVHHFGDVCKRMQAKRDCGNDRQGQVSRVPRVEKEWQPQDGEIHIRRCMCAVQGAEAEDVTPQAIHTAGGGCHQEILIEGLVA